MVKRETLNSKRHVQIQIQRYEETKKNSWNIIIFSHKVVVDFLFLSLPLPFSLWSVAQCCNIVLS